MKNQKVGVIGAGFSGGMIALQLLKLSPHIHVTLFERSSKFGTGAAYSTESPHHLLNVPAARMSAFDDQPDHFLTWWKSKFDAADGSAFAPRQQYGRYLQELLAGAGSRLSIRSEEVREISRDRVVVTSGGSEQFDAVVLATGNYPPANPVSRWISEDELGARMVRAAGSEHRPLEAFGDQVFILGSGLTAVDIIIDLDARGYTGQITVLSRRGLMPQPHDLTVPGWEFQSAPEGSTLRELMQWFNHERQTAELAGVNWRAVLDALRPRTQRLWQGLSLVEKRRFLRHLRPYWDVHRHRLAPELQQRLSTLEQAKRLKLLRGRIQNVEVRGDRTALSVVRHGSVRAEVLAPSVIVNCTGPTGVISQNPDPLLQSLFRSGTVSSDPTGLGLSTTSEGILIDLAKTPVPGFYAVGPLRKGELWECTAVRELRGEAAQVAATILSSHH
jgi:uncharacterized NAD(P)/FAD-binding protein YdhS